MAAKARIGSWILAAAALAAASLAHAQVARPAMSLTTTTSTEVDPGQFGLMPIHRTLQWDDKGRWSLTMDMSEPAGRTMQLRDVQAGAYYHVTPSLKFGGAFSLGDAPVTPDRNSLPQAQAPKVKLETRFKF